MRMHTLALIIAAAAVAGCVSNETKPEPAPAAAPAPVAATPPPPAKPECAPEPVSKKKPAKTKKGAKEETAAPVDCEPAKPKAAAEPAKAEPAPPPPPAKDAGKAADPGKPRIVKSRDGTFEGEIYGNIPAGSKWARLQIGMEQPEVERILGVTHDIRHTPTGKAFMPFYYGTDRYRNEHVYRGQGSVSYTSGGHWGAGRGVLMMINYDPNI